VSSHYGEEHISGTMSFKESSYKPDAGDPSTNNLQIAENTVVVKQQD